MLASILLTVSFGGVGCILLLLWCCSKKSRLPPGPPGWPLVGNAFQQDPFRPYLTWSSWAKKYGDLYTIKNFGQDMVMCNNFEALWELLVSKSADFAGRPAMYPFNYIFDGGRDIATGDFNPQWSREKKIFMTKVKMYGDGLKYLEEIMLEIVAELAKDFEETDQQPFDPLERFQLALCNTLSLMLLGFKFDRLELDFQELLSHLENGHKIMAPTLMSTTLDVFPWLHYLPLPYCRLMTQFLRKFVHGWIPRQIQRCMVDFNQEKPHCIMDAFVKQLQEDQQNGVQYPIGHSQLIAFSENIFLGGIMTSTATLYTLFALITAKSDIQSRAQEEVDKVLGGRHPTLKDKINMPYFQAMLEETFRYAVIVPGFPHKATKDSSIRDHFIPKNTRLLPNVWHLCHDEAFWDEPWTFKPERFLDDEGNFLPASHPARKRVLTFGAGRRICPGELLARNRIFLITTSMLQKFVFYPGEQLPQCDPRTYQLSIIIKPQPFKMRAKPRQRNGTNSHDNMEM